LTWLSPHHLERLLEEGWSLLDRGKSREAALVFGRVLLIAPAHPGASEGRERAEAAAAEHDRLVAARLAEAIEALERGDYARARVLVDDVLEAGGDRDRALQLLDRLDARAGRVSARAARGEGEGRAPGAAPSARRPWMRAVIVGAWAAAFVALAAGIALRWEGLVTGLVRTPSPSAALMPPTTELPTPSEGERALSEARRLNAQGNVAGALAVLDRIPPQDPAYPFARQLRGEAESALRQGRVAF
jgi:tetratricopeptide (TPR) repeat protein